MTERARQKALKLAYKEARPPMGLFAIRNLANGRMYVDKSMNLTASLNRHRMELRQGVHRHRALMADWRSLGEANFSFEVLERLSEPTEPGFDPVAALADRLAAWRASAPASHYA